MPITNDKKWSAFWFVIAAFAVIRMVMVSDVNLAVVYGPHDSSLYLTRAFHLLNDGTFGVYDSKTLLKSPGISFWIAMMRCLDIPYMLSINLFHILSSLYLITALRRAGVSFVPLLATFALLMFNSIVLANEWFYVGREPLDLSLSIMLVAGLILFFVNLRSCRALWCHGLIFAASFMFLLLLREENVLLWSFLPGVVGLGLWQARLNGEQIKWNHPLLVVGLVTAIAGGVGQLGAGQMIGRMYGLAIINDFNAGEFPKFISALRSVSGTPTNPYVSITQKALVETAQAVPAVVPLVAQMPAPPGFGSYFYQRWGVSDEWSNSHIFILIKDAAYTAGLTPDLPAAQAYFRQARLGIEQACRNNRLKCTPSGEGLFPPLRLEWLPLMGKEMLHIVKMTGVPPSVVARGPSLPVVHVLDANSDSPVAVVQDNIIVGEDAVTLGRQYQLVAQSRFDTLQQWQLTPPNMSQRVAREQLFTELKVGATQYLSPLGALRQKIVTFGRVSSLLVLLGIAAVFVRLFFSKIRDIHIIVLVAVAFLGMCIVKTLALGFISIHMGALDHRLFYSTHLILMALAPALLFRSSNAAPTEQSR